MKNGKPAALSFIFITLIIDITGLGIIVPIMPKLIGELIHGNISQASEYGGWLTFAYALMQFIFAPVLGNLSDRFGRRPVILLALLGFGINYIFMALAPTIGWLFVGRVLSGVTGASFTAAAAYIADISTPEKRAQNFGIIGAAFGIGFIIGPVLGGVLGQYGVRVPFLAAAGLTLLNCLFGYFVLPESLTNNNRRAFSWKRASPVGALLHLRKFPAVSGLVLSLVLVYIGGHAIQSTWTYYTMERFNWNEALVGYSLGSMGIMAAVVQGGLIRVIIPKIGQERGVYIGLLLYAFGFFLFAFAAKSWLLYVYMIPYALGGISGPALQGIISNQVPDNEQGELQGGLTSLMSATSIVGPPLMASLFAYFTAKGTTLYFPGAPFLLGALMMLVSAILAFRSFRGKVTQAQQS